MNEMKKVVVAMKTLQNQLNMLKVYLRIKKMKKVKNINDVSLLIRETFKRENVSLICVIDKARETISKLERENPNIFKDMDMKSIRLDPAQLVANDMKKSVDRVVDTMVDIHRAVMVEPKKKK